MKNASSFFTAQQVTQTKFSVKTFRSSFSLKFSRHCVLRDGTQCRALFCYENEEMKKKTKLIILFNILISRFWFRDKARCCDPPLGTQSLQNSVESGEQNVLALGSLCLLCYKRNKREAEKIWSVSICLKLGFP